MHATVLLIVSLRARLVPDFDTALFLWTHATAESPGWLLRWARFLSLELPSLMIAGAAGAWIVGDARVRRDVALVFAAMLAAWLLARIGQALIPSPRPFALGFGPSLIPHGDAPGFPSKHASVAMAFAFAMLRGGFPRPVVWSILALSAAIGWSRVYLGVHFPSDVLAGAVVGAVSVWLMVRLRALRILARQHRPLPRI